MKVIMWVLLVTFVLWGGSSAVLSRSKRANFAGIVSGKRVGWKEFERAYSAVENQAKLMYGEKFNEVRQYLNLRGQAWDRVLLLRQAGKNRIRVSDDEAVSTICSVPLFQDSSGKFVPQIYKRVVEYFLRVPARQFEEEIRGSIAIAKLKDRITSSVGISEAELKEIYAMKNEKANADYITVNAADFKAQAGQAADLERYYRKHREEFRAPARINMEYIPFEYGKDKESQDKADDSASDVSYELAQSERPDFAAVAKKFGRGVQETGFFAMDETIPGIGLSYPVAFEAFKLPPGRISPPIKTPNGRYIIKVKERKDSYIPPLDEIRQKVKDAAVLEEAQGLARQKAQALLEEIKQKMAGSDNFKKACAGLKLSVKSTGLFTKEGYIPEIGKSEEFADAVFSAQTGKLAGVADIPEGAAVIFVAERTGIDEEKFEAEKETFRQTALEEKKSEHFEDWFKELKQRANVKVSPDG